jgi:hypothetical protein
VPIAQHVWTEGVVGSSLARSVNQHKSPFEPGPLLVVHSSESPDLVTVSPGFAAGFLRPWQKVLFSWANDQCSDTNCSS